MSLARIYELACDRCDRVLDGGFTFVKELRQEAKLMGWKRRSGADICAACISIERGNQAAAFGTEQK